MAFINGDDEHTWGPDPSLTPLGHEQTKAVGAAWKREAAAGAPVDKIRFFTSPLQRTCQTMINSWGDMLGPPETWEVSARRTPWSEWSEATRRDAGRPRMVERIRKFHTVMPSWCHLVSTRTAVQRAV